MLIRICSFSSLFSLVLVLSFNSLSLPAQSRFTYSKVEADTILIELSEALKEYHPFAYQGNGNLVLDSLLTATRTTLPRLIKNDSIHVADLIQLASRFNDVIGDGHLQLTRKRDSSYLKMRKLYDYDFYTRYTEDGKIILSDTLILLDSTTFYPGAEVLTFQGEAVKKMYSRLGAFMGLNDHNLASAKTYFPAQDPASFYQRLYGWQDSLLVELRTGNQRHKVLLLPSARVAYINRDTSKKTTFLKEKKKSKKEKKQDQLAELKRLIRLDTTTNPDVYKLSLRTFSSGRFSRVNEYKHVKKLILRLDSLQAKGLIIDLRNNTGGSLNYVNYIYSMIATDNFYSGDEGLGYNSRARGTSLFKKIGNTIYGGVRKKNGVYTKKSMVAKTKPKKGKKHFSGEVVALVNETTFSGGTCFANYIQTYGRGKVVGQVSGGSAERMYAGILFKEPIGPEKSLLINMPLWYMDMPGDNFGNITPDLIVPRSADAVKSQRDETLEVAIESFSFQG